MKVSKTTAFLLALALTCIIMSGIVWVVAKLDKPINVVRIGFSGTTMIEGKDGNELIHLEYKLKKGVWVPAGDDKLLVPEEGGEIYLYGEERLYYDDGTMDVRKFTDAYWAKIVRKGKVVTLTANDAYVYCSNLSSICTYMVYTSVDNK